MHYITNNPLKLCRINTIENPKLIIWGGEGGSKFETRAGLCTRKGSSYIYRPWAGQHGSPKHERYFTEFRFCRIKGLSKCAFITRVPTILKFRDSGFAESRGYQNATIIFFAKNQWPLNAIHGFQAWVILSLESVVAERVERTPAHKFMGIVA